MVVGGGGGVGDGSVYILIPGAGHDDWVWRPVAERLRATGRAVLGVTLPGMGIGEDRSTYSLDDATQHVVDLIEGRDLCGVRLVAHSLGGITLAATAARVADRVSELVFVNAYVPQPGESLNDANPQYAELTRNMIEAAPDGTVTFTFEMVAQALMQGCPEPAQRVVHTLLTPTPGRYFTDPYAGPDPASLGIPTRYVLAADDRGLARPGTELATRLGVQPIWVPGTHEALLTHPDEVAKAIVGP